MPAPLFEARSQEDVTYRLRLPPFLERDWQEALPDLLANCPPGPVDLDCGTWPLNVRDLQHLIDTLEREGLSINGLEACRSETVISANALGLQARLRMEHLQIKTVADAAAGLRLHQGTLRSGDHVNAQGHLLLVGDVNPGARVSAAGDVLVWGRLRGVAHAGCLGNSEAKIVALQLRPLQLRIADCVARGPDEQPQPGFAEQARIVNGEIVIEAAQPLPPIVPATERDDSLA
jgi:septum site-determining protein MinC